MHYFEKSNLNNTEQVPVKEMLSEFLIDLLTYLVCGFIVVFFLINHCLFGYCAVLLSLVVTGRQWRPIHSSFIQFPCHSLHQLLVHLAASLQAASRELSRSK